MDINDLRGIATILTMVAFLSVVFWAYSSKRKKDFDEAANLPFADESPEEQDTQDSLKTEKQNNE